MKSIKTLSAAVLVLLSMAAKASAQTDSNDAVTYPQFFIGVQGGGQTTLTDYNNWKLVTPTASFSIGSFFTPIVGARLHLNGMWNKGGYCDGTEDFKYKYKYLTTDLDILFNLVTLFGRKNYYPMNVYLIGGFGFNYAWDNSEAFARTDVLPMAYEKHRYSHNARIGLMFDYNVSKHVSINLEADANTLSDRYNSKMSNKGDWQITAQLGVAYKFGVRKKNKELPTEAFVAETAVQPVAEQPVEEVWETRQDTIWYDEPVVTSNTINGSKTWTVFYEISESNFNKAESQLAAIGAFLKDHHDCKVDVKSYADAKTGNSKVNMQLSKQRMEKAVKALTDAGVPAASITSKYYGDTVQPYAENDKNRVTIIVATGLKDDSQKKMVRKFKTKEVRYRVR